MNLDFVRRFAPQLALDGGQPTAGAPAGGLNTEDMVDVRGAARPWMQVQGEARQYFGNDADYGLRGRLSDEPYPQAPVAQPAPSPFGTRLPDEPPLAPMPPGRRGNTARIPRMQAPVVEAPKDILGRRGNTAAIPPPSVEERIISGVRSGGINLESGHELEALNRTFDSFGAQVASNPNVTLAETLQQFFPRGIPGLRGRTREEPNSATVDPLVDQAALRTNAINEFEGRGGRSLFSGRAEGVAELLRQNGVRIPPGGVIRSRNALRGGHPEGNSIDIDPRDRALAQRLLNEHYRDLPVQFVEVQAGQRFANGVRSTGHHFHIDLGPAAQR